MTQRIKVWRVEWFGGVDPTHFKPKAMVFDGKDWADLEALHLQATAGMSCIRVVEAEQEVPDDYRINPQRVPPVVMARAREAVK
jgi:hypothetical protein